MVRFTKMHGLGNDFVCMNYDDVSKYNLKIFSKFVCDRHFGIGADGLILVGKSKIADCKMRIFNSDGTEAEMCGNGIRCLAKYIYEKNLIVKDKILVETLAGVKVIKYQLESGKIMNVSVQMGIPQMDINKLPIYVPRNYKYKENKCKLLFRVQDKEFTGIFLTVGNPHTVIEVKDLNSCQVAKYGKIIENYKYFPKKTNVEFVEIVGEKNIKVRVWERGVGETLACGTGAVASAFAMFKENRVGNDVDVELAGGTLNIKVDLKTNEVCMTGPAINSFEGEIDL